ncbi:MAG: CRISPR-associated endonuclease Cas3'' [Coriobacteriales bacterium]|jgi:CRISPR-associated endonuclease/helicase Cas3|nr:CRISPR-associated endonuclease Cas3'' [Coriobacteriales bacterium]
MLNTALLSRPQLSNQAQILWGKSGDTDSDLWLPLFVHLSDTAEIAAILWDEWVAPGVKQAITDGLYSLAAGGTERRAGAFEHATVFEHEAGFERNAVLAKSALVLLALLHDVGKATPIFQMAPDHPFRHNNAGMLADHVENTNLVFPGKVRKAPTPHALTSFGILKRHGWHESFAVIAGSHHGRPPSQDEIRIIMEAWKDQTGFNNKSWRGVQDELVMWAEQQIELGILKQIKAHRLSKQAQILLTGLVIMADWIASDEQRFPLIRVAARASLFSSLSVPSSHSTFLATLDILSPFFCMASTTA